MADYKVSYGGLSLDYDFCGGLPRIFRASSADLPRCRQNCFLGIGGHPVATRWPATRWPPGSPPPGGHPDWEIDDLTRCPPAPDWEIDDSFTGCPPGALRPLTSAGVFRGSSADLPRIFRGAGRMRNR